MRSLILTLGLLLVAFPAGAQESPLVGTWALVSASRVSPDGVFDPEVYGPAPHGYISYTAGGHMMVLFTFRDRPNLNGSWRSAPENERAQAFATVLGYGGTYTVDGNTVTHHIDVSTDPNRVGTSVYRTFELDGDRVTLTTPPVTLFPGDLPDVFTLVWERVE